MQIKGLLIYAVPFTVDPKLVRSVQRYFQLKNSRRVSSLLLFAVKHLKTQKDCSISVTVCRLRLLKTQINNKGRNEMLSVRSTQRQFSENISSEDDLRSRIFGTFVVKSLACLPLLGFLNI